MLHGENFWTGQGLITNLLFNSRTHCFRHQIIGDSSVDQSFNLFAEQLVKTVIWGHVEATME